MPRARTKIGILSGETFYLQLLPKGIKHVNEFKNAFSTAESVIIVNREFKQRLRQRQQEKALVLLMS